MPDPHDEVSLDRDATIVLTSQPISADFLTNHPG
jgi:hypothetical protein